MDKAQYELTFPFSFYDKYTQKDENIQAHLKCILNQIYENRVTVKELHIQFAVRFSEMIISYRTRLEELKNDCEALLFKLNEREKFILKECHKLRQEISRK